MAEISGEQVRKFFESLLPARLRRDTPVVPVVRLTGVIGFSSPLRPGVTLAGVSRLLDRAFAMRRAKAVAILINSPGGSPVQSHLIFRRIRQLADEKKIPVIVFIEDAGASGGYMIACAGDEIYCDPFSIVGSIGVVGATFGFDKNDRPGHMRLKPGAQYCVHDTKSPHYGRIVSKTKAGAHTGGEDMGTIGGSLHVMQEGDMPQAPAAEPKPAPKGTPAPRASTAGPATRR